jgi:hypothetical protein
MIQLMVLDDEADALRAALAPRLPADITARYYRHGADVDRDGLAAEVAFGQPDALAAVLARMRYGCAGCSRPGRVSHHVPRSRR